MNILALALLLAGRSSAQPKTQDATTPVCATSADCNAALGDIDNILNRRFGEVGDKILTPDERRSVARVDAIAARLRDIAREAGQADPNGSESEFVTYVKGHAAQYGVPTAPDAQGGHSPGTTLHEQHQYGVAAAPDATPPIAGLGSVGVIAGQVADAGTDAIARNWDQGLTARVVAQVRTDPSALPTIEKAAKAQQDNSDVQALLSLGRSAAGNQDGTREAAEKAIALDPDNRLARLIIGHPDYFATASSKLGSISNPFEKKTGSGMESDGAVRALPADYNKAEAALAAAALGVPPGAKAEALFQSALDKIALGDLKGALFDVSRALLNDPTNLKARVLRAHLSNLLGNYKGALQDVDEILKRDPTNAAALFEKGYALLQTGDVQGSLAAIERGLKIAPNDPMGTLYHAMALEKAGLAAAAIAEYQRAAALDASLAPLVEDALARLRDVKTSMPKLPSKIQTKYVLWLAFLVAALALLLEGGKRVFYPDWKTTVAAKPDEALPATASGTLAPGTILGGNFRIEGEVARGGIGVVYKATDIMLKRTVAIKHLSREAYESGEVRERFLKEAQLAAKLRHPNLAQIFSVVGSGELYLVFEFVKGETLHRRLVRERALKLDDLKTIVGEIALAVDYAHSQGVIHRDLKPANVMITPEGRAKVMDFGIAKETRSQDATQTQAWGTPPYMAPEQEMGAVCKESDLYALGVMIYELAAGERPFQGAYSLDKKLKADYRPIKHANPDAPGELHAFFKKALAPDPKERFHSAAELARALNAIEPTPVRG